MDDPNPPQTGAPDASVDPAQVCPHEGPPVVDPSTFPACDQCGGGAACVPNNLVPAEFQAQLASCDAESLCVPNEFVETAGNFIPPTCESIGGLEGRCLSTCIPDVAAQAEVLPQATCGVTQVCAPCFDPISGMETGACRLSCDPGPVAAAPMPAASCCEGRGSCIQPELAGDNADALGPDTCPADSGLVCAPNDIINGTFVAASCTTEGLFIGGQPGACLPDCLAAVDSPFVSQADCADGFRCAPCEVFGDDTGACDFLAMGSPQP